MSLFGPPFGPKAPRNRKVNRPDNEIAKSLATSLRQSHGCPHLSSAHLMNAQPIPWSPHLRVLLCGTRDHGSPIALLRGHEATVVRLIYELSAKRLAERVELAPPAELMKAAAEDPEAVAEAEAKAAAALSEAAFKRGFLLVPSEKQLFTEEAIEWTREAHKRAAKKQGKEKANYGAIGGAITDSILFYGSWCLFVREHFMDDITTQSPGSVKGTESTNNFKFVRWVKNDGLDDPPTEDDYSHATYHMVGGCAPKVIEHLSKAQKRICNDSNVLNYPRGVFGHGFVQLKCTLTSLGAVVKVRCADETHFSDCSDYDEW